MIDNIRSGTQAPQETKRNHKQILNLTQLPAEVRVRLFISQANKMAASGTFQIISARFIANNLFIKTK